MIQKYSLLQNDNSKQRIPYQVKNAELTLSIARTDYSDD